MIGDKTPPEAATSGGQDRARADGLSLSARLYSSIPSPLRRKWLSAFLTIDLMILAASLALLAGGAI